MILSAPLLGTIFSAITGPAAKGYIYVNFKCNTPWGGQDNPKFYRPNLGNLEK
jgi:hypothetical protein